MRIAIFASGSGSNAEALIRKAQELSDKISVEFVLTDRQDAFVLQRAQIHQVRSHIVERTSTRKDHEDAILKHVDEYRIDWIFLAGYMRLIGASFLQALRERHQGASQILNIHPSLLPAYPGTDSIERAYKDQVSKSGVTIHQVDEGMDTGPIILQQSLPLLAGESLADFKARVHQLEHSLYTQVLTDIAFNKIPTQRYMRTS
ncbi:phosphoribosylglycinamide formyltransferase [Bdellovibrio sp. HCB2-146]|uniref:phosphoribosylglycinamide formyltransferase n=1 Tax=Bdellovibrio sp. HCB2-146 TaxID=3394362 RepID=UPI0039BD4601